MKLATLLALALIASPAFAADKVPAATSNPSAVKQADTQTPAKAVKAKVAKKNKKQKKDKQVKRGTASSVRHS